MSNVEMQNRDVNKEFKNAYSELEKYLIRVSNYRGKGSVVWLYEQVLYQKDTDRASTLETIRKFRNNVLGHGKEMKTQALASPDWIDFLKAEITYIRAHEKEVALDMKTLHEEKNKTSFSSALENLYRNRKNDAEMSNSFGIYSKLSDECTASEHNKRIIVEYFEVDKKMHLFESIGKEKKDLHSHYHEVASDIAEKDFHYIIETVERIVNGGELMFEEQASIKPVAVVRAQENAQSQTETSREKELQMESFYRRRKGFHWWKVADFFLDNVLKFFIAGCLMIALLAVLGEFVSWTSTTWQWWIGVCGGLGLAFILFAITCWLDEGIVIEHYVFGTFSLVICTVVNFILFLVLRSNYKIIFGCISTLELIFGAALVYAAFDDVEGEWGVAQIITLVVTLFLMVVGVRWM